MRRLRFMHIFRAALLVAPAAALLAAGGCGSWERTAVRDFEEQYARTAETEERVIAASYPYQLEGTAESEVIAQTLARIRNRAFSDTDLEEALAAERGRGWYIDHFANEVEAFRREVAALYGRANVIGDEEVRRAAEETCRRLAATLEAAGGLVQAQQERSEQVREFFSTLLSGERRFPSLSDLEAASAQLQDRRQTMLETIATHEAAFGSFLEAVERRLGMRLEEALPGEPAAAR